MAWNHAKTERSKLTITVSEDKYTYARDVPEDIRHAFSGVYHWVLVDCPNATRYYVDDETRPIIGGYSAVDYLRSPELRKTINQLVRLAERPVWCVLVGSEVLAAVTTLREASRHLQAGAVLVCIIPMPRLAHYESDQELVLSLLEK
jgi:hypothetical protein